MKKTLILGLFAVAAILFVTGCTSVNSSDGGSLNIYPETIGPTDNYRPLYKIDTKNRVVGKAHVNILFGMFMWGDGSGVADNADVFSFLPDARRLSAKAAFYNACKEADCDSIVAARYEITRKNYLIFSKCEVEVKGFPATLSGVEVVKPVQYYVNADGDVVFLDKYINPIKIADEGLSTSKKSVLRSIFWFF